MSPKSTFIYEGREGYVRLLQIRDHKTDEYKTYIRSDQTKKFCSKDEIMIGRYGPPIFQILRGLEGAYNVALMKADPTDAVDRNYLYHFIKQESLFKLLDGLSQRTAGQSGIDMDALKSYPMYLPPLEEQKRIAAILDTAGALRRKRQKAIALTDDLLRSVFLDMFGDPVTNPKGWDMVKFGTVGQLDRGKSKHRPRNDPILLGGDHPFIQTGDVANSGGYITEFKSTYSDIGLQQSKKWPAGTLCITIAANIANTGVLEFDACFPDSIVGFTPNEVVTVEYVQAWLSFLQKIIEDAAPESAQKNINLAILRNLEIPLPDIEKQEAFSKFVHKNKKTKSDLKISLDKDVDLFSSLTQRAFRGELTAQKEAS